MKEELVDMRHQWCIQIRRVRDNHALITMSFPYDGPCTFQELFDRNPKISEQRDTITADCSLYYCRFLEAI